MGFLFLPPSLLSHCKILLPFYMIYSFLLEVTMISIINAVFNWYK